MNNDKMIYFLKKHYSKRLKKALKDRGYENREILKKQYQERFLKYMGDADFGNNNERFSSYLNIFSGLAAYELLQENGFSKQDGIEIYDYMCRPLRKVASVAYRVADLLPKRFEEKNGAGTYNNKSWRGFMASYMCTFPAQYLDELWDVISTLP